MDEGEDEPCRLLYGDEFGLKSNEDLRALGERAVRVRAHLWPDESAEQELASVPLTERRTAAETWFMATYERMAAELSLKNVKLSRRAPRHQSFECELSGEALPRLLRLPEIQAVYLLTVEGVRRRASKARRMRERLEWYAVRARFAIQVEDETRGMQLYEDRLVLVKAHGFEDAKQRLAQPFAEYGLPHFNGGDWARVRWRFERVLDIYQTDLERLDPAGAEVYSRLGRRRMRPAYEWRPQVERQKERDVTDGTGAESTATA